VRAYRIVPTPGVLIQRYNELAGQPDLRRQLLGRVVGTRALGIERNAQADRCKTRLWWVALIGLAAAVCCSTVSLALGGSKMSDMSNVPSEPPPQTSAPSEIQVDPAMMDTINKGADQSKIETRGK
jgi:hypothetical protein